mgnify:CR=1 FL=1
MGCHIWGLFLTINTWQTIGYGNINVVLVKIIGVNEWLSRRKLKKILLYCL